MGNCRAGHIFGTGEPPTVSDCPRKNTKHAEKAAKKKKWNIRVVSYRQVSDGADVNNHRQDSDKRRISHHAH